MGLQWLHDGYLATLAVIQTQWTVSVLPTMKRTKFTHKSWRVFAGVLLNAVLWLQVLSASAAGPSCLSLAGHDWHLKQDAAVQAANEQLCLAIVPGPDWIPAQVPGNIQDDLERAHKLRPLFYGATDSELYEVARKNWWYRKDFVPPADLAGQRLALVFDGVDEQCEIWLNGTRLGTNAGMFRRFEFDVSASVRPGQTNQLAVRIERMPEELVPYLVNSDGPGEKDPFGPYGFMTGVNKTRQRLKDLKTPGNFSYDWAFNVWTLGIWKDVRLEATGPARILWTRIETSLSENFSRATVRPILEVDSPTDTPVEAIFTVTGPGGMSTQKLQTELHAGVNFLKTELPWEKPGLWWPSGQGAHPLYTLKAELKIAGGVLSDTRTTRFGMRDIRWVHTEGAPTNYINRYQLVINGRKVRTIGSGLILPGVLPVRVLEHNLRLLHQAVECGFNVIRINGGGGGPLFDQKWYDLADELGIMIQWETPIGNSTGGLPEIDEAFLRNLEVSFRSMIKECRNHPCIIEFGGGNEMEWDESSQHPALQVMRKVAAEETETLFRATSPDLGGKHAPWDFDIFGSNTGYGGSYDHYNHFLQSTKNPETETMSYSEFGTCSPSHLEVWHRDAPLASQWPLDNVDDPVLIRKNATRAVFSPQHWLVKKRVDNAFGTLQNLPDFIRAGQYLGADGLRYIYDELRRKGLKLANITSHCYSEPCPNLAGSYLVDYDGRTLMNYDFLKQALAPISLSLRMDGALFSKFQGLKPQLFLVSDAMEPALGWRWKWLARDGHGRVFARNQGIADIHPLEVKALGALDLTPAGRNLPDMVFVELRLESAQGDLMYERLQVFAERDVAGPLAGLLRNRAGSSSAPAAELPNLALVSNGAKPATASSSRPEPHHQPAGLNDGRYGTEHSWIPDVPRASFQIDLGQERKIGRMVLSRDRTARFDDRPFNYLKIETSLEGQQWQPAFEQNGITDLPGFTRGKSLQVELIPAKARFVRVTIESTNRTLLACIDECAIYAPAKSASGTLPRAQWGRPAQPIRRTSLQVSCSGYRISRGQEVLEFTLRNRGSMTALFCEPHPVLAYRTDLFIQNNNCFIPPGESRVIQIRASCPAPGELSLVETDWRISCWNADEVEMPHNTEVLLALGRRDGMCREFGGYFGQEKARRETLTSKSSRPDAAAVFYRLQGNEPVQFAFDVDAAHAGQPASLSLYTADQADSLETLVAIELNGCRQERVLPKGLGIQLRDPAHLAFPATVEFNLPGSALRKGRNLLTVRVKNGGWLSWDALNLVSLAGTAARPRSATVFP